MCTWPTPTVGTLVPVTWISKELSAHCGKSGIADTSQRKSCLSPMRLQVPSAHSNTYVAFVVEGTARLAQPTTRLFFRAAAYSSGGVQPLCKRALAGVFSPGYNQLVGNAGPRKGESRSAPRHCGPQFTVHRRTGRTVHIAVPPGRTADLHPSIHRQRSENVISCVWSAD